MSVSRRFLGVAFRCPARLLGGVLRVARVRKLALLQQLLLCEELRPQQLGVAHIGLDQDVEVLVISKALRAILFAEEPRVVT